MSSRVRQPRSAGTYVRRLLVVGYLFFLIVWPVALAAIVVLQVLSSVVARRG